jgi:SNF2 family DNA or RNA helicase
LGTIQANNVRVGITQKRDWFNLSGTCELDGEAVDLSALLEGLQNVDDSSLRGDYVRLGDAGWAKISQRLRQRLQRMHDSVNHERGTLKFDLTSAPVLRDVFGEDFQIKVTREWSACLERLKRAESLDPIVPSGLQATLRDYQVEGYRWLRRLAEWGVGGILADDMGLGKTLQALAVMVDRAAAGPALVIAPTSVGFNWMREAKRFAPDLISLKAGGTGLNLTAADYVIHMDPWWNPAVEDQATDRAHRIGQDKPVMVYRIVSRNTIEEEILKLHETKRDLVAGVMDGTHGAGKLSIEELISLIRG